MSIFIRELFCKKSEIIWIMRNLFIVNIFVVDYINVVVFMEIVCIIIRNYEILKVVLNIFLWK